MEETIIIKFPIDHTYEEIDELKNSSVDILIFDENFKGDLCIFEFPDTIIFLEISCNCSLAGIILPKYLKKLRFGKNFNQSLENVELPDSLEILEFADYKNSLFSVKLPKNLKKIINKSTIITRTLYSLPFFLPKNVKKINLGSEYSYKNNAFVFPKTLKKLAISGNLNNKIIFTEMYDELKRLKSLEILDKIEFAINKLPDNIKKLKLPFDYDSTKTSVILPTKLEHLTISGNVCNESIINNLPTTIKSLEIINNLDFELGIISSSLNKIFLNFTPTETTQNPKNKKLNGPFVIIAYKKNIMASEVKNIIFPNSVKKIIFSDEFNCSIPMIKLPEELEKLKISGKKCNEQIINNLPQSLQSLEIVVDLEFELNSLPFSLKHLFINVPYKQITINQTNLPNSLETIKFFKSYPEQYFKKPFNCEFIVLDD